MTRTRTPSRLSTYGSESESESPHYIPDLTDREARHLQTFLDNYQQVSGATPEAMSSYNIVPKSFVPPWLRSSS
ncbi:hypothetical protein Hte_009281 [Hypoxylon texense]